MVTSRRCYNVMTMQFNEFGVSRGNVIDFALITLCTKTYTTIMHAITRDASALYRHNDPYTYVDVNAIMVLVIIS